MLIEIDTERAARLLETLAWKVAGEEFYHFAKRFHPREAADATATDHELRHEVEFLFGEGSFDRLRSMAKGLAQAN